MRSSRDLQQPEDKSAALLLDAAINALAKALKAMNFYPPEHPLRDESVSSALENLNDLLSGSQLVLLWSREACTLAGDPPIKNSSLTARSLAREMLTRKLQRLIILPGLSLSDLKAFLSIATTDAANIQTEGGIEAAMLNSGITTICANEVNLSLLSTIKNGSTEPQTAPTPGTEGTEADPDSAVAEGEISTGGIGIEQQKDNDKTPAHNSQDNAEATLDLQFSKLGMDILLGMLKAEDRESHFLQLAREVIDSSEEFKQQEAFEALLHVIEALIEIYFSSGRSSSQKEFIKYALEQIASGAMTGFLLDRIEEHIEGNEPLFNSICSVLGQSLAYPLIQRLCVAESLHARKTIAIALTRSGEAAISALVAMLRDERWYVVRNMVTILGEIVSPESIKALRMVSQHPEPKVRKEVVKALVKVNPQASEAPLISMLAEPDKDVLRQVIFSLGTIRSKTAIRPLLEMVNATDTFLKDLELKKMAVSALGRIGDKQATEPLLDILYVKGWFAPRRWHELKVAAATALGHIGDESALPKLKRLANSDSDLGKACGEATDNIERVLK
ncbi:MAG: HEAT repeat domain-containing protein [Geobacteraceae bacterium]|nr:HEAT repeat domain-containing protein [Geobacteraceae bacterium]